MEWDKEFLRSWRNAYVKLINDAVSLVGRDFADGVRIYREKNTIKDGKLEQIFNKVVDVIFHVDEESKKESVERLLRDPQYAWYTSQKISKDDSEYSERYKGLEGLFIILEIMQKLRLMLPMPGCGTP